MARSSPARRRLGTARGPDLYDVLQVPQDASAQAITASYHALEARMREQDLAYDEPTEAEREVKNKESSKLRRAFEILSSPLERSRYDAAVLRYQGVRGDHWTPSKEDTGGEQQVRQPARGDFWAPSRDNRQGDSWVAARDGRNWPTPPKRTEDGIRNR